MDSLGETATSNVSTLHMERTVNLSVNVMSLSVIMSTAVYSLLQVRWIINNLLLTYFTCSPFYMKSPIS